MVASGWEGASGGRVGANGHRVSFRANEMWKSGDGHIAQNRLKPLTCTLYKGELYTM